MLLSETRFHGRPGIGLVLLGTLIALPIGWVVGESLLYSLGLVGYFAEGFTLRHWQAAFTAGGLRQSLVYTPLIAGLSTLLASGLALSLATWFPDERNRKLSRGMLCLLLGTPTAVLSLMVDLLLNPGGYVARVLFHLGVIDSPSQFPPLVHDPWSMGVITALTLHQFPLLALYFLGLWKTLKIDRYCQIARTLGASPAQCRWRVVLPMLIGRGRALVGLCFLFSLGSYEIPLLLGSQAPQIFSVLTSRHFGQFDLQQRPQAFVLATTYISLVMVLLFILLRRRRSDG